MQKLPKKNDEGRYKNAQVRNPSLMLWLNMQRKNILIPKPNSSFISVECTNCGEKKIIFSYTTTDINCESCHQLLAGKTGARAKILGKVLSTLDWSLSCYIHCPYVKISANWSFGQSFVKLADIKSVKNKVIFLPYWVLR